MAQFNKLIDLRFRTDTKEFEIKTPRHGRKPQLKVSGNITAEGFCSNLEVEVTNLFTNEIQNISEITVQAGYEGEMNAGITGKVQFVYTASPGPDKVTVINCTTANFDAWVTKTINLKLKQGFSLGEAIEEITGALGFEAADIDSGIAGKPCPAPLEVNGRCSEAIKELKKAFPGVSIIPVGNRLHVFPTEAKRKTVITHELPFLMQAPQFSGGLVSVVAPWNPMIKAGDYVKFPLEFRKEGAGSLVFDTMSVSSIQFSFATNTDENEMTISGTMVTQMKAEGDIK